MNYLDWNCAALSVVTVEETPSVEIHDGETLWEMLQ